MSAEVEQSYLSPASSGAWSYRSQQGHCILIVIGFLSCGDDPNPTHRDSIGSRWMNCA